MKNKPVTLSSFLIEKLDLPCSSVQKPEINRDNDFTIIHAGKPKNSDIHCVVMEYYERQGIKIKLDANLSGHFLKDDMLHVVVISNASHFHRLMVTIQTEK